MTGTHMTRIVTLLCLLACSFTGQAALKLILDGQEIDVETSVLDTANSLLTVTSGSNLACTGFDPVDPATVPLAIKVDNNQAAAINNDVAGSFTVERDGADTVTTVNTVDTTMSCNSMDEEFFKDGFEDPEDPPPQ